MASDPSLDGHMIGGVYWAGWNPVQHTAHLMVNYTTRFSDGTPVQHIRANVAGVARDVDVSQVTSHTSTRGQDIGEFQVTDDSMIPVEADLYYVPGGTYGSERWSQFVYFNSGVSSQNYQRLGQGFMESSAPFVPAVLVVVVVILAIWQGPRLARRLFISATH